MPILLFAPVKPPAAKSDKEGKPPPKKEVKEPGGLGKIQADIHKVSKHNKGFGKGWRRTSCQAGLHVHWSLCQRHRVWRRRDSRMAPPAVHTPRAVLIFIMCVRLPGIRDAPIHPAQEGRAHVDELLDYLWLPRRDRKL